MRMPFNDKIEHLLNALTVLLFFALCCGMVLGMLYLVMRARTW